MNRRPTARCIVGICAGAFALGGSSYAFPSPSTPSDAPPSPAIVMKELNGNVLSAKLVGDRITDPVQRLRLSKEWSGLALSPNGKTLAYTSYSGSKRNRKSFVELLDLGSGQIKRVTSIPSDDSCSESWSHDGRYLAVKVRIAPDAWKIGVVAPDGTDFRFLTWADLCGGSAIWGQTDTSFYYGDFDRIYEVDLEGTRIRTFPLKTMVPGGMFSIPWSMDVLHNSKRLLLETELRDEEVHWHVGGRGAIYFLNLSKGVAHQVSPDDISARQPAWVDRERYLFLGIPLTEKNRAIIDQDGLPPESLYLGHIESADVSMLHEKVWEFSVSAGLPDAS